VTRIHPTAIVDPAAELGDDVEIGPFCVVEADTVIGARTVLQARAMVRRWTTLGADNVLMPGAVLGGDPQHLAYRGERTELRVGDHNWIGEYVTLHRASHPESITAIGGHNYFMAYSHVGHDCRVGDHIVMTNYAGLAGHCTVEDRVLLAAFSGAHQGVTLGTMAMLGAGALAGQDIVPYVIVQGVPARPRGLNVIGMQRNGVSAEARAALHEAYRLLFSTRLSLPNAVAKVRADVPDGPEVRRLLDFIARSQRGIARRKDA
jgi:UDP-N-acetylglucosamine acyltransferase